MVAIQDVAATGVEIKLDGRAETWQVWRTREEAFKAAERDSSRSQAVAVVEQQDEQTGFTYVPVVSVRPGVVSLDDLEEVMKVDRYTWLAEVAKAGVQRLAPGQACALRGKAREDGGIDWKPSSALRKQDSARRAQSERPRRSASTARKDAARPASEVKGEHEVKVARQSQRSGEHEANQKAPALWGRTFIVPGREVGQGSYHFVSEDEAYLNYETMPKMEDPELGGRRHPKRCDMKGVRYDPERRKLHGTIDFTATGNSIWTYDIVFDDRFVGITGQCKMCRPGSKEAFQTMRFGRDAWYVDQRATKEQVKKYMSKNDLDAESQRVVEILGRVCEQDERARKLSGRGRATGLEALNLIMGKGMMEYHRDKKYDDMLGGFGGASGRRAR